jgi:hypothetical protein
LLLPFLECRDNVTARQHHAVIVCSGIEFSVSPVPLRTVPTTHFTVAPESNTESTATAISGNDHFRILLRQEMVENSHSEVQVENPTAPVSSEYPSIEEHIENATIDEEITSPPLD